MALQALGAYAEKVYSPVFNITVTVTSGADKHHFNVSPENAIVLQSYQVRISLTLTFSDFLFLHIPIIIGILIHCDLYV